MRLAKDGRPYDVDHLVRDPELWEVEVIQYLRPNGKRRRMLADVGDMHAELASDMLLSCEALPNGAVAIYARYLKEDEEKEIMELAVNGPGQRSPTAVLKLLIERKAAERSGN